MRFAFVKAMLFLLSLLMCALLLGCPNDLGSTIMGDVEKRSDAALSALIVSAGALSPTFEPTKTEYMVNVDSLTTTIILTPTKRQTEAKIEVRKQGGMWVEVPSGTSWSSGNLTIGDNIVEIRVTAENGTTFLVYTITVHRISANALLSALSTSSGSLLPAFNPNTLAYTVSVQDAITTISSTQTAQYAASTIMVRMNSGTWQTVGSGIASPALDIGYGDNLLEINVEAEDGTSNTYVLTVHRINANPALSNLLLSSAALTPSFIFSQLSYSAAFSDASVTVTPTAAYGLSVIRVRVNADGWQTVASGAISSALTIEVGDSLIEIQVTAEDGTLQTYSIAAHRWSENADLSNLTVDTASISPAFDAAQLSYVLLIPHAATSVRVTPTAAQAAATITVNGQAVSSGIMSSAIDIPYGKTTVTIIVTAESQITTRIYAIDVYRSSFAEPNSYVWAQTFHGDNSIFGRGAALDGSGNVFAVGDFFGTNDFDPGAGTDTRTSVGYDDAFIVKLDGDGGYEWAATFGGGDNNWANGVMVDSTGCVYLTGCFSGTVDFNPGPGLDQKTATGYRDGFILKLGNDCSYQWAAIFHGNNFVDVNSITVDGADSIYVTGYFSGTTDFDPGSGVDSRTAVGGGAQPFVTKLDSIGNYQWTDAFGGGGMGNAIAISGTSLYIAGHFQGTYDFDPGAGTDTFSVSYPEGAFLTKLETNGAYGWTAVFGGTSGGSRAHGVAVDASGNVFLAGYMYGTVDFDPGAGVDEHTCAQNNAFITKLTSSKSSVWTRLIGDASYATGFSVGVDGLDNIFFSGTFSSTIPVDFDSSSGTCYLLPSAGEGGPNDVFLMRLNDDGDLVWAESFGIAAAMSLAVSSGGTIIGTGYCGYTVDFDPGTGTDIRTFSPNPFAGYIVKHQR